MIKISRQRIPNPRNRMFTAIFHYIFLALYKLWSFLFSGHDDSSKDINAADIKKILLLRYDGIGDIIMSSPIFKAMKQIYPNARVTMLAASWSKSVISLFPDIDEVVYFDAPWIVKKPEIRYRNILKIIKDLKIMKYDMVIDLRGDFRNNLLMYLIDAPLRLGFDIAGCDFFLSHLVPSGENHHFLALADQIVRFLSPDFDFSEFKPLISVPNEGKSAAMLFLASNCRLNEGKPIVTIHPAARWPGRQWNLAAYAAIGDRLAERYSAIVILTGTRDEIDVSRKIFDMMKNKPVIATGKTGFQEFLGILEKSDLFLGVDSGPMHLAAALRVPVVALFGPALVETVGPGKYEYTAVTHQKEFPCSPCSQLICPKTGHSCMDAITVDDVWAAVETVLKRKETQVNMTTSL